MKLDLERNLLLVLQQRRRPDLVGYPRARHIHRWRYTNLHQLGHESSQDIFFLLVDQAPLWQRFAFVQQWSLNFDSWFYLVVRNQPGQWLLCRSMCTRMISWVSRLSSSAKIEQILYHVINIGIGYSDPLIIIVGILIRTSKLQPRLKNIL